MGALRPFFSYYGGKWRDAANYPAPRFDTIVEPFAGSAGYALRHPDRRVILCDIDFRVAGVWRYLIRTPADEILALPDVPAEGSVDDLDVPAEARWLIGFWLNRAVSSPRTRPSQWMRSGVRPGCFWGPQIRERIASQLEAIRHWTVLGCSYDLCPHDGPATWFIDPPYQGAGRHYAHGSKGIDYPSLATWCQSREGQVIVCENEGARWLPFRRLAATRTTRGQRSHEAVWTPAVQLPLFTMAEV